MNGNRIFTLLKTQEVLRILPPNVNAKPPGNAFRGLPTIAGEETAFCSPIVVMLGVGDA